MKLVNIKSLQQIGLVVAAFAMPELIYAQLEEIVVTAQKREQSAQDVAIALTTFSGEQLNNLNMETAKDLALQTPGLSATNALAGGVPIFAIRGIGLADFNPSSAGPIGLYQDDVYQSAGVFFNGQPFDLDRSEVLKGPQGTLYGRNTTGGAIKFISQRPTDELESRIRLRYGRFQRLEAEAAVSGPLSDAAQARLAASYTEDGEGWQHDAVTGREYGKEDRVGVRGMLAVQPSDALDVLWILHASRDNGVSPSFISQDTEDIAPAFGLTAGQLGHTAASAGNYDYQRDEDGWGTSLHIDWDLNVGALTSITAVDEYNYKAAVNYDGAQIHINPLVNDIEYKQFSQEFRLASAGDGRVTWMLGASYGREEADGFSGVGLYDIPALFTDGALFDPRPRADALDSRVDTVLQSEITSLGLFAHFEIALTDRLELVAGVRLSRDEVEYASDVVDLTLEQFGNAAVSQLFGHPASPVPYRMGGVGRVGDPDNGKRDDDDVTGKIGFNFRPGDQTLLYAFYSRGNKGGRYFIGSVPDSSHLFYVRPESVDSFEIGFKTTTADKLFQLNGAAFFNNYKDRQSITSTAFQTQLLVNTPESELKGGELEALWAPLDGLTVSAGVAYLDSKVTRAPGVEEFNGLPPLRSIEGVSLPQAPEWSYNVVASYEFQAGAQSIVGAQINYAWTDEQFMDLGENPNALIQSRSLLGARLYLGADSGKWEVALWGRNLTNEDGPTVSVDNFIGLASMMPTKPRTYGIEAVFRY